MSRATYAILVSVLAFSGVTSAQAAEVTKTVEVKQPPYGYATNGVLSQHSSTSLWRVLLDHSNLGGSELEVAELTLKAGTIVGSHTHDSLEVFYVVSGVFGHEVNGHYFLLKPGMVGVVRAGDKVRHIVPKGTDAKVLVIWAPGGEVGNIVDYSKGTSIGAVAESKAAP